MTKPTYTIGLLAGYTSLLGIIQIYTSHDASILAMCRITVPQTPKIMHASADVPWPVIYHLT